MALPVVTVASGGIPVVDVTATAPKLGLPVTETTRGIPVTKVTAPKPGLAVVYGTFVEWPPAGGAFAATTWNPSDKLGAITLSAGNLTATCNSGGSTGVRAILGKSSGKFYWELTRGPSSAFFGVGLAQITAGIGSASGPGVVANNGGGSVFVNGVFAASITSPLTVVGIATDISGALIWFRNAPGGVWNAGGAADPATGVGGISIAAITGVALYPIVIMANNGDVSAANFSAVGFTGAVPSGFTAGWPA
jgi:hypothetical protein